MKSTFLLTVLCIFFSHLPFSTNAQEKISSTYESYFEHYRESVFLHLNKTTFLEGEEIWWSAYVYDKKSSSPSFETKNLYCGIYDTDGNQIKNGLFLVENGKAYGSFQIDQELSGGTYYIRAGTLWMQNFKEDEDFVQKITVISDSNTVAKATDHFDLQILPEGGHLIAQTKNAIGIRVINDLGQGIKIKTGQVLDRNNKVILTFSNNYYGVGKFDLFLEKDQKYKVRIFVDEETPLEKEFPIVKEKGVVLAVNNILKDKLIISVNTNEDTLKDIGTDPFYLAVHRDGLMNLNTFTFEEPSKKIVINKNKLLSGTNIITLFNKDLQPVSERLIFNYKNIKRSKVAIETPIKKLRDSVAIKINVFSKNNTTSLLSMSALPSESIAYGPQNNIISNFLLQPYIKSPIENAGRYFTNTTRKKEFELDLVLLTQGWSKYDWGEIFNNSTEIVYPFEKGITLRGTLNSKIYKGDLFGFHLGDITSLTFFDLQNQPVFNINNIFLYNGDNMGFTIKNKRKKLRKPDIDIRFEREFTLTDISLPKLQIPTVFNEKTQEQTIVKGFLNGKTIALDEVVVSDQKIEKKLNRSPGFINQGFFNGIKIGEDEIAKNPLLTDLINRNGFRVIIAGSDVFIINPRPQAGPVGIFVDDFPLQDSRQLFNLPLSQIDEIYFNKDGINANPDSAGGEIRIYLKEGGNGRFSNNPSFAEKLVENSFIKPKKFYRPKYASYTNKTFEEYGIIHWDPNIITDNNGNAMVKIPNNGLPNIKLFVEGMSSDGSLISHMQEIQLN